MRSAGKRSPGSGEAAVPASPRPRRAAAYLTIAVLLAGSVVAMVRDDAYGKELWPFSAYPMYSTTLRTWSVRTHRLFGVVRGDPTREFPLVGALYLHPFEHTRFYFALNRVERLGDRDLLEAAIRDTLVRYEARREAGRHAGPALEGVRLYELDWRLDPRASPAERERPQTRRLLLEVAAP